MRGYQCKIVATGEVRGRCHDSTAGGMQATSETHSSSNNDYTHTPLRTQRIERHSRQVMIQDQPKDTLAQDMLRTELVRAPDPIDGSQLQGTAVPGLEDVT